VGSKLAASRPKSSRNNLSSETKTTWRLAGHLGEADDVLSPRLADVPILILSSIRLVSPTIVTKCPGYGNGAAAGSPHLPNMVALGAVDHAGSSSWMRPTDVRGRQSSLGRPINGHGPSTRSTRRSDARRSQSSALFSACILGMVRTAEVAHARTKWRTLPERVLGGPHGWSRRASAVRRCDA
jgi:hypothetical protein